MKRVTLFTLVLLTAALLLSGCTERGNVNHVHKSPGKSAVYTEADIEEAMDVVIRHFRRELEGCTLIHLYYDEENYGDRGKYWAMRYDADEAIVLLSTFETGPDSAGLGLNPDDTYSGYQWILTRNKGGSWTLRTSGYG